MTRKSVQKLPPRVKRSLPFNDLFRIASCEVVNSMTFYSDRCDVIPLIRKAAKFLKEHKRDCSLIDIAFHSEEFGYCLVLYLRTLRAKQ